MANPEHLDILKQGVDPWNKWRGENLEVRVNLLGANLTGAHLFGSNLIEANLFDADLTKANLTGAYLTKANLTRANLTEANLKRAHLSGADLSVVNLTEANLTRANLTEANLSVANMSKVNLAGAELSGANLSGAKLPDANLTEANLSVANMSKVNLAGAELSGADLSGAKLPGADLYGADLSGAELYGADLSGADLYGTNLSGAKLSGADLSGADLSKAKLPGADLFRAKLQCSCFKNTLLVDIDLRHVEYLEETAHFGPSYIDVSTIIRSGGNIPESFLRGCGVPENFIQYIPSLVAQPIQFYSCFISYSSKDQDFAERLYVDLQNKGVRCWYAPEDMKIGDKIRDRIDQSIRVHDKLLLILSEYSINSEWVEDEGESAYEQEKNRGSTVLFPIRLDDAVMDTEKAWAAKLRRSRHIGDFTNWKDHDSYQNAFDRLLNDLKAERE